MASSIIKDRTKELERLLSYFNQHRYAPRSTIIHAGDDSETLYYVVKGSVIVFVEDDDGHDMIISYLNTGEFFGEMGLFDISNAMRPRSAWVQTKTACVIAELSYEHFRALARKNPELIYLIGFQMADRLRKTTRKVADLAFLDVTGRIARSLLDLCAQPDAVIHPEGIQIRITRQEVGRIVGCSREMVGRVLKGLEDQGLVQIRGKTILVYRIHGNGMSDKYVHTDLDETPGEDVLEEHAPLMEE